MPATQWRQKFHTDDKNQCLHNKSGSHGVLNANLFNFTFLLVNFGKVLCSSAKSSSKTQCFFQRRIYSTNIDCFVMDSLHSHLTFVAFCLLSVIRKQWLRQCNYFDVQSALLTEFRTDFTSSVWNFCHWVADVPPCKMSQWQGARRNDCFRRLASVPHPKKLPQTQYDIKVRVTCMHMLQESCWFCQSLLPLDRPKIYVLLSTFILFISKVVRINSGCVLGQWHTVQHLRINKCSALLSFNKVCWTYM